MTTILTMRAPGMTWSRLPIFVWGVLSTSILMALAAPVLVAAMLDGADGPGREHVVSSSRAPGGSPYLYENLFWFFGHPEVYILALPGFGIVLEILPVFARKPLWGYRLAVAGMLGVTLLSFMVWQHHLFVSGMNASLRPFYMLTTELISIPTGFIFLNAMGTLWRGADPLHGADAVRARLLLQLPDRRPVGSLPLGRAERRHDARQLLRDGALPLHDHGRPRLRVLRARPTTGCRRCSDSRSTSASAKIHFWLMFVFFNLTFFPLFAAGFLDMPRRVSTYAPHLQTLNDFVSASAYRARLLDADLHRQPHLVARLRTHPRRGEPVGITLALEWQVPTPVPV